MEHPQRRSNRLSGFDYGSDGIYFITICVQDRKPVLSNIVSDSVGAGIARPFPQLTATGKIVEEAILAITSHYQDVNVDHYVIMPNHVHMLIRMGMADRPMQDGTSIPKVIQQFKGYVTKRNGAPIWQKSYYDHIIRNEADYLTKRNYMDENPLRWRDDELYAEK